jgi:hypothetical protein
LGPSAHITLGWPEIDLLVTVLLIS